MRLAIPLNVPGVTEADVDPDARVGVKECRICNKCGYVGFREWHRHCRYASVPGGGYVLVLDVPESPRTRVERRRWTVTQWLSQLPEDIPIPPVVQINDEEWWLAEQRQPAAADSGEVAG